MLEPTQTTIDERSVALFRRVTGQTHDAKAVMVTVGNPDFSREITGADWEHYVPTVVREQWRSLSWEARVVAYALAEDRARVFRGEESFD